jgi:hypothetical protein
MIIKNKSYAPRLIILVLLLVLFDDLLVLLIVDGHKVHQVILYMHAIMMQHLAFRQRQLLKCITHAKLPS